MKFILMGNNKNRHAFNIALQGRSPGEKHKVHLEGGKVIDSEELDMAVQENGSVKRIKIVSEDLDEQLFNISKVHPKFVKFVDKPKMTKKD